MEPHAFTNLGGKDKPLDHNDIALGRAVQPTYDHPPTLHDDRAWGAPVEYQGQQPACGPHSGTKVKGIRMGKRFSPRATWADVKTFDGYALEDGTDMRSIFKSLTKEGALDFDAYGNDVSLSLQEYVKHLTPAQLQLMKANIREGYGFITDLSFEGIKQFIDEHGPSLLLMRVSARFWTAANGHTSWAEKDILPLAPASSQWPAVSGHFVVVHSYDEKYIYFLNSFGPTWGRNGHGYFGADYMPMVNDVGTLFGLVWTKDLYLGVSDPQVKQLQQFLNQKGFMVATSGNGSPGNETEYFGELTKAAVIKYQLANNIAPAAGYCGPLTRAHMQVYA